MRPLEDDYLKVCSGDRLGGFECLPAQIYDGKLDPSEVSSRNEDLVSETGERQPMEWQRPWLDDDVVFCRR